MFTADEIGWAIFLAATAVQLFYWLFFFVRLAFYRVAPVGAGRPGRGVSVVICAHDEAENLRKNLHHFLNQNYRSFEIIVVNDNSSDETGEVLLEFQRKSPKLRVINAKHSSLPGKKLALTQGIEASHYDVILLSDADCRPAGPDWIFRMQGALRSEVEIGLGYSPYAWRPGWLNRFIRFETIYTATQYLSFALAGYPYMGVGRNLIYTKSVYRRHDGFQRHLDLMSGDDDLFVNQAAHYNNTNIVLEGDAFVYTEPKHTWRGYYYQKRRHLTTGRRYRPFHQLLLGALSASHAAHYLAGGWLIFSGSQAVLVFLTYLVRMGVVAFLYYRIMRKLDDPSLWKWVPLLDAGYLLYYFSLAPVLITGKVKQWK
jgi:glycosyltransferase involved in cell wall biosynthesis